MNSKIGFKAERVNDWNETTDTVQWRTGNWAVREDVPSATSEYSVERCDGVCRSSHGAGVNGLHKSWRSHQERRIAGASGSGDDLATPPEDRFGSQCDLHDLEPAISDCYKGCQIKFGLAVVLANEYDHGSQNLAAVEVPALWKENLGFGGDSRSSHKGPSRVAQLKPWRIVSLTLCRSRLST